IYVCTDLDLIAQYASHLRQCRDDSPSILEISDTDNGGGIDFGDPEGGYSIIETEIIIKRDLESASEFLDKSTGLFRNMAAALRYVDSLPDDGTVENLSGYQYLHLREVAQPAEPAQI
ncbi:MAG: hypothetical protein LBH76_07500, partial [Propionibacteriaceae bacterium]|nr:hypothetical protein [Propionibacteriaceae bacterium]